MPDIDPNIVEWCYAREVLRRMGFSADELFFVVVPHGRIFDLELNAIVELGKPAVSLVVRAQGLEFTWTIGTVDVPVGGIESQYVRACEMWNTGDPALTNDDNFFASRSFGMHLELASALYEKGFRLASMGG